MICYKCPNCPNWQPLNPSTVNGADTECFDPVSTAYESCPISGMDLFDSESLDSLRKILLDSPSFKARDISIERIGSAAHVQIIVRGLFENEHKEE